MQTLPVELSPFIKEIKIAWQFSIELARNKLNIHYQRVFADNSQYKKTQLTQYLTPAAYDSFDFFRPIAHGHFDLLLSDAAIECHRHFAAWSDGADVAVEFVGRLHRMAVELGDEVARS